MHTKSSAKQGQNTLFDFIAAHPDAQEEARLEAEYRATHTQVQQSVRQLEKSGSHGEKIRAARLKFTTQHTDMGEVYQGLETDFTIDTLFATFGMVPGHHKDTVSLSTRKAASREKSNVSRQRAKGEYARVIKRAEGLGLKQEPMTTLNLCKSWNITNQKKLLHQIENAKHVDLVRRRAFGDHPPLHRAVLVGDTQALLAMLNKGSSPQQMSNVSGKLSAFQVAVMTGNADAVQVLINAGANVEYCSNDKSIRVGKRLHGEFQKMIKIQQQIDVLKVKMSESADEDDNQSTYKNILVRLRQEQLLHEQTAQEELETKLGVEAEWLALNGRQPLALACFSKNPYMIDLLINESAESEIGLPVLDTSGVRGHNAKPLKLMEWCQRHFKLGALLLDLNAPHDLGDVVKQPLFGVFYTWVHHVHKAAANDCDDDLDGIKIEMTIHELILGFQRFGLVEVYML